MRTILKGSYNCKMGIRRSVRCRPTLAYRVHFESLTALISATEQITRYYSNEKSAQCCLIVIPTSATLADIKPTFRECAVFKLKKMSLQVSRSVKGGLKLDSFHFILLGQSNPSTLGINKLVINKNDHLKLGIV